MISDFNQSQYRFLHSSCESCTGKFNFVGPGMTDSVCLHGIWSSALLTPKRPGTSPKYNTEHLVIAYISSCSPLECCGNCVCLVTGFMKKIENVYSSWIYQFCYSDRPNCSEDRFSTLFKSKVQYFLKPFSLDWENSGMDWFSFCWIKRGSANPTHPECSCLGLGYLTILFRREIPTQ